MTKTADKTTNPNRNEAQRLFDGFTVDVIKQVVFNADIWRQITEGYAGRLGRELLVKSKDLNEPINASTSDGLLCVARYYLDGNTPQALPSEISRGYTDVVRNMTGINLEYLILTEDDDEKTGSLKKKALLRFMRIILDSARDRTDLSWDYLEKNIPACSINV